MERADGGYELGGSADRRIGGKNAIASVHLPSPLLAYLIVLSCTISSSLSAQTVRGLVVDDSTRRPVVGASVALFDESGKLRSRAMSDAHGFYSLPVPGPGAYALKTEASDYTTFVTPDFEVGASQNVDIELRVSRQGATSLAAADVTTERVPFALGPLRGFYERRERGSGEFVTRQEIEETGPVRFTDILYLTQSAKVIPMPRDRPFGPNVGKYTVRIEGARGSFGSEKCQPILYLDDERLGPIDEVEEGGPDMLMSPHSIEGIEVYRPSVVPTDFGGSDATCGVIIVWTKRSP